MNIKRNISKSSIKLGTKFVRYLNAKGSLLLTIVVGIGVLIVSFSGTTLNKNVDSNTKVQLAHGQIDFTQQAFKFSDINNTPYDLSGLKGSKNIILYSFQTSCILCINEINTIVKSITSEQQQFFSFIVLSKEDSTILTNFSQANKFDTNIHLVSDPNKIIYKILNINENIFTPSLFIFDKSQHLINVNYGYSNLDQLQKNIVLLYDKPQSNQQLSTVSNSYKFSIDSTKIQNGCLLANKTKTFLSLPNSISPSDLKKNISSDDMINCIDTIYPTYSNSNTPSYINNGDEVFYININGVTRIYPYLVLVQHPYIEDYFDYLPVGIFYDGLTNSINAFSRVINNEERNFLISGRIYNNHFLLIDKKNFSLWDGKQAISGDDSGIALNQIPVRNTVFDVNSTIFKNSIFLLKPQDLVDYSVDPLKDYKMNENILYPQDKNNSLFNKKIEVIKIQDQILNIKDIHFPLNGETKNGLKYLIIQDEIGGISVYDRTIKDFSYTFDNSTGIIIEQPQYVSVGNKKIRITPTPIYFPSTWSKEMIGITGKFKDFKLKEIPINRGYYFYEQ